MSPFRFQPAEWHETLPSTNTELVERVKSAPKTLSGSVVATRNQTAGRGRQQRSWHAKPGQNLTFSFLWNGPIAEAHVPSMAMALSVGIARMLHSHGLEASIKWPNDVLVNGKKISGILCERVNSRSTDAAVLVAGIGLNVNMDADAAAHIDQPATSIALETGHESSVERILEDLLVFLAEPVQQWSQEGFAGIRQSYEQFAWAPGTPIQVRDGEKHIAGIHLGFNADGGLIIQEKGTSRVLCSGDLSLREAID